MHITAKDLLDIGVIDRVIPEFGGANSKNVTEISRYMKREIIRFLNRMDRTGRKEMIKRRYDRFRKF